jgi:hypothetical protein
VHTAWRFSQATPRATLPGFEDSTVHVLTKIFVVLVSLLAVLLVPLVVVHAHNEDSFKARWMAAQDQIKTLTVSLDSTKAAHGAEMDTLQRQNTELSAQNDSLQKERFRTADEVRRLETELASARGLQTEVLAHLANIDKTVDANQQLVESLVSELRTMRNDALASERRAVELDEALRDVRAQLEVAVAARRALQEELQRVNEELAKSLLDRSQLEAGGDRRSAMATGVVGISPDRNLVATVVSVSRSADQTLAEINVGSRDGVKTDWVMQLARGGTFLANLHIIRVDVNRSTGIVLLEDQARGMVQEGDRATARKGN